MAFILTSRDFLLDHVAAVRASVAVKSKADRENLRVLEADLAALARRHTTLARLRVFVFVCLYATIVSNLALPVVSAIVEPFMLITNLLGLGIFSLTALYLTWRLGQLWDRMGVVGSHVLAIYEKHNRDVYDIRKEKAFAITKKR